MNRPRIGEICVELGLLDTEGVERTLALQAEGARARFGEAAMALGLLDDVGLSRALAQQFRLNLVPASRLSRLAIAPEVLALVPAPLVRERLLVPAMFDPERGVLSLLIADPTDLVALRTAQSAARVPRLRLFVSARSALRRLVTRLLPREGPPPLQDAVPGLQGPPLRGLTILIEPDRALGTALRRIESIEQTGAEVVEDPAAVTAMIDANEGRRIYYRSALEPRIAPYVAEWRRVRPEIRLCAVPGWSDRHAIPSRPARAWSFEALETGLLAVLDPVEAGRTRRRARLARLVSGAVGLTPEDAEAVWLAALYGPPEDGPAKDGAAAGPPWALLATQAPPWPVSAILAAVARRESGEDLAGHDLAVEVLTAVRAVVRAAVPDGTDPLEALGGQAAGHDGSVLRATQAVLRREGLRRRLCTADGRAAVWIAITNPIERLAVEARLDAAGFDTVTTAESPLTLARGQPPVAVVLDQHLPPRDTLTAVTELRRERLTRFAPLLVIVDRDTPRLVTRAFELGATDIIERPLQVDDVSRRLRRLLAEPADGGAGVVGAIEDLDVATLLHTLRAGACTGRLVLAGPSAQGELTLAEGVVRDARLTAEGMFAETPPLQILLSMTAGSFAWSTARHGATAGDYRPTGG